MATVSRHTVVVAGLPVHVFSERELGSITGEVVVLFFLHGRKGSANAVRDKVESIVRFAAEKGSTAATLLVVTIDQRNHGKRLVDDHANNAWKAGNERHGIDMYATYTGTAADVSYLIDWLPSYLFPSEEAQVAQWTIAGSSLGGHAAWYLLCHEPRLKLGIPIIGCPDYLHLITNRARYSGVPFEPPHIPTSFLALVRARDPAHAPYTAHGDSNPFLGKKVLVLSGGADRIVPWASSDAFVTNLVVGPEGVKKVIVYDDLGHECTEEMLKEAAGFVWEHALSVV